MAKQVENLSLNMIGLMGERQRVGERSSGMSHDGLTPDSKPFYIDEHVFLMAHLIDSGPMNLVAGQPYRVDEGRVLMITSGWVRIIVNLEEHRLEEHALLVLVADSIFEIVERSPDFDMRAFSFKDLPLFTSLNRQTILEPNDDEWLLANEYFNLMWHEAQRQPLFPETITHLQTALLLELKRIADREESQWQKSASRQDKTFHQFLHLVNMYGLRERKIEFYADKLSLTPNHLGAVIKKTSGLTIMQWLNRHTIQKSKVLLRYSDLSIWEIAERMNFANPSFFSKFFKNETGMTPGEYRQKK